jgi:hypothetical protein
MILFWIILFYVLLLHTALFKLYGFNNAPCGGDHQVFIRMLLQPGVPELVIFLALSMHPADKIFIDNKIGNIIKPEILHTSRLYQ